MKYLYIQPEVAGGLGENTVMDRSVHPPIVTRLHYKFDGWLGDVLLRSFPCLIVTKGAKERLQSAGLTGIAFDKVEVTTSELFQEIYLDRKLPEFVWLKIVGKPGQNDFGFVGNARLVISERALKALEGLGISNALVTPFDSGQ